MKYDGTESHRNYNETATGICAYAYQGLWNVAMYMVVCDRSATPWSTPTCSTKTALRGKSEQEAIEIAVESLRETQRNAAVSRP